MKSNYNSKTLIRLWGALFSDFETMICRYLAQPGIEFTDFAEIAKELRLSLIMNITVGRGKNKEDYYTVISTMIFDVVKTLWLQLPMSGPLVVTIGKIKHEMPRDELMCTKRAVGAFFCLYSMYMKQPYQGRTKISLSADEVERVTEFKSKIEILPNKMEIKFILAFMTNDHAFRFSATSVEYGIEGWRRHLLTVQKHDLMAVTLQHRDVQDHLGYSTLANDISKDMRDYLKTWDDFMEDIQDCTSETHISSNLHTQVGETLPVFMNGSSKSEINKAANILKSFAFEPILTMENLNGSEIIDRRIMADTRRRINSRRKRVLDDTGPSNPYIREGGIYGRKKQTEEGKLTKDRRERGLCSENLWTYLCNRPFDKPMMNDDEAKEGEEKKEPSPGTSAAIQQENAKINQSNYYEGDDDFSDSDNSSEYDDSEDNDSSEPVAKSPLKKSKPEKKPSATNKTRPRGRPTKKASDSDSDYVPKEPLSQKKASVAPKPRPRRGLPNKEIVYSESDSESEPPSLLAEEEDDDDMDNGDLKNDRKLNIELVRLAPSNKANIKVTGARGRPRKNPVAVEVVESASEVMKGRKGNKESVGSGFRKAVAGAMFFINGKKSKNLKK